MMFSAREGDLESARAFAAAGANVNAIGGDGKDVLGLAIFNGNYELASFLIDSHADVKHADAQDLRRCSGPWTDVNASDNYGITPLMVAANMGEMPIIQFLIDKGGDLGAYDLGKKNDGAFGSSIEPLDAHRRRVPGGRHHGRSRGEGSGEEVAGCRVRLLT